jgi:molecular chaperone DnaK (HSP70)
MWALDLGSTNSLLARWDPQEERPRLVELPSIGRGSGAPDASESARVIPSAVHALDEPIGAARVARWLHLPPSLLLGQEAVIGQRALDLNRVLPRSSFVRSFKRELSRAPLAPIARLRRRALTAREVGTLFLRELLIEAKRATGERIRELVITTPVESFDTYRAELAAMARKLGIARLRFLDEPVAAALGYGLGVTEARRVLVVDFGGGTLHVALLQLGIDEARAGKAVVVAKAGRDLGGNLVDQWVMEELCARLEVRLVEQPDEEEALWRRLLLVEACRVKEALRFAESATFDVTPPESLRQMQARLRGEELSLELQRADLVHLLTARGLYAALEGCLSEVLEQARQSGGSAGVDEVLMVGGSTLLPEVYPFFESRFGRASVRAWQPFEAVAHGATIYAANRVAPADFIVHDYALLTFEPHTNRPLPSVVVPRGTRFPTVPDLWKRQLVPTCSLGEPESVFKLVICEIGQGGPERTFTWDGDGRLHQLGGASPAAGPVIVKLNEANPALGHLDPPHSPRDHRPRLEVSLGVNSDRWLCATVLDLHSHRQLMRDEPVVRLV